MNDSPLRGRRLLVTAGPTWVPIDAVRHLANLSTGRTGLTIALRAAEAGARVTLLLGPGRAACSPDERRRIEVRDFTTFDDLHALLRSHVSSLEYDALVHTAAVADYRPVSSETGKLSSEREELVLRLERTPKLVDLVKRWAPGLFVVKFKLEVNRTVEDLLRIARESQERSRADLLVVNDLSRIGPGEHAAWITDRGRVLAAPRTTEELADALVRVLGGCLPVRLPAAAPAGAGA